MKSELIDKFGRQHNYLRISLTDKCNFNCTYCNPNNDMSYSIKKSNLLTYEEILRMMHFFAANHGFNKFRFTGGEPFARKGLMDFFKNVKFLKDQFGFKTGITTNGSLLKGNCSGLFSAGIDNLNISLDSLNMENFNKITGKNYFQYVISAIDEAIEAGYTNIKINCVVIKNSNDNELVDFVNFAIAKNLNVRFIEYMPFGNNDWQNNGFVSYNEMFNFISNHFKLIPTKNNNNNVAKDFLIEGHNGIISFISSISQHFCGSCNRLRVSSDGKIRLCLFTNGNSELNIKEMFRDGYSDNDISDELIKLLNEKWEKHPGVTELRALKENNMFKIGG
ncbi:MAG: GTP 3',8-cyclase MoaA [Bacteroidetes bacterium]|nr:GTP 3',8-cyclase MoaA [Bacteroidota bacterium]